jgi:hypothetical protein
LILKEVKYTNIKFDLKNFMFLFTDKLELIEPAIFKESKVHYLYCPNVYKIFGGTNRGTFQDCKELSEINLPLIVSLG